MALRQSELITEREKAQILANKLQENHRKDLMQQAEKWNQMPGVRVNYSFFENKEKNNFSREEVAQALSDLGIDIKNVKGKKWYQFSKNKWDTKLQNAIKAIQTI